MKTISRSKWYARLGYVPRRGQQALDEAAARGHRYLSLFAFPRAGKSFGAARHVEPSLLQPDTHGWIVAPKYEFGAKEFGYIWQDLAETGFLKMADERHFDVRGGNMRIHFPWGAFAQVVSADNPENLRTEELDWVILAEASLLAPELWERSLYARLEKRRGLLLVPTTPKGYNWNYDKLRLPSQPRVVGWEDYGPWENGLRSPLPGRGRENPRYDPVFWSAVVSAVPEYGDILEEGIYDAETIDRARELLPPPIFREQFGGDFASYAGLIYAFSPLQHECDPFSIPDWWTHVVGWDDGAGGGSDPTAILCGSYAPDGTLYWWGEVYDRLARSVRERANDMQRTLGAKAPSAIMRGGDAKQVGIELAQMGFASAIPADRHINARIIRMTALMREDKWKIVRGTCPNLRRELLLYEWDEKNPGKPKNGQSDHAVDAAGMGALAPVGMPTPEDGDPDALPGESPEITRLWRGLRRRDREAREEQEGREFDRLLNDDPFEEDSLVPSEYVLEE